MPTSASSVARRATLRAALLVVVTGCHRESSTAVRHEPGAASALRFPCHDPALVLIGGQQTGYERCASGEVHRREVRDCPGPPRAASASTSPLRYDCSTNEDCGPGAICTSFMASPPHCEINCLRDADCGPQQVCECGETVNTCVPARCASDANCPVGHCIQSKVSCGHTSFVCQTAADECGGDADCAAGVHCIQAADGHQTCGNFPCPIGRPLSLDGDVRRAPLQRTVWDGWLAGGRLLVQGDASLSASPALPS